jgi:hypothetical protein
MATAGAEYSLRDELILRGARRRLLRANVLRRRPLAVTSPFTSHARASALRSTSIGVSLKGCCQRGVGCRKPSLVGAGRGMGKVKEEGAANGRRRGTFAQTPACPDGAPQLAETPTKRRSSQTPGKKRPGRGRDLPGPDCMGGGTHAMSVGVAPVAVASRIRRAFALMQCSIRRSCGNATKNTKAPFPAPGSLSDQWVDQAAGPR